jgi:hypothetical protein
MVPALYNFLYSSSRPALRAACGRPRARQRHDGHTGRRACPVARAGAIAANSHATFVLPAVLVISRYQFTMANRHRHDHSVEHSTWYEHFPRSRSGW